jgi:hypothetical protein
VASAPKTTHFVASVKFQIQASEPAYSIVKAFEEAMNEACTIMERNLNHSFITYRFDTFSEEIENEPI